MKYYVTKARLSGEKSKSKMTFYNMENDLEPITYKGFIESLNEAIIEFKTISRFEFEKDNLLQIEYFEDGELKKVSFLFDKNIKASFIRSLQDLASKYSGVYAKRNHKNVDTLIQEAEEEKQCRAKIESLLTTYIKTGVIVDASSDKEASLILSKMMTNGKSIIEEMQVPLGVRSKRRAYLCLAGLFETIAVGISMLACISPICETLSLPTFLLSVCIFMDRFLPTLTTKAFIIGSTTSAAISFLKAGRSAIANWKKDLINSFVVDYNNQHDFFLESKEKTEIKKVDDAFIRLIMQDIEYIRKSSFEGRNELLREYESLANEYITLLRENIGREKTVDMMSFLKKLVDIEARTYGQDTKKGLKRADITELRTSFYEERLGLLGISFAESANDLYLKYIFEQAERIFSYPYEGCEAELVELYTIALDYVSGATHATSGLTCENRGAELLKRETALELVISEKIANCQKYEKLADDIEKLETLMGEAKRKIKTKSDEKKITLEQQGQQVKSECNR